MGGRKLRNALLDGQDLLEALSGWATLLLPVLCPLIGFEYLPQKTLAWIGVPALLCLGVSVALGAAADVMDRRADRNGGRGPSIVDKESAPT